MSVRTTNEDLVGLVSTGSNRLYRSSDNRVSSADEAKFAKEENGVVGFTLDQLL